METDRLDRYHTPICITYLELREFADLDLNVRKKLQQNYEEQLLLIVDCGAPFHAEDLYQQPLLLLPNRA